MTDMNEPTANDQDLAYLLLFLAVIIVGICTLWVPWNADQQEQIDSQLSEVPAQVDITD